MVFVRPRWYTFDQTFYRNCVRRTGTQEVPMSAALKLAPTVFIPAPARAGQQPDRLASVSVLHAPSEAAPASWRLTRRGVAVVTAAVLALGVALIWLARVSA